MSDLKSIPWSGSDDVHCVHSADHLAVRATRQHFLPENGCARWSVGEAGQGPARPRRLRHEVWLEEQWIREGATVIDGEATEVETAPPASRALPSGKPNKPDRADK
jgi:hypothetical protein